MTRFDLATLDFVLFFLAAMVVLIYKTISEFQAQEWLQGLNLPPWALPLVPFTATWTIIMFLLVVATYRAYHFSEHKFGLVTVGSNRAVFISASIDVGFILILFHILVWAQNFFVSRDPKTAFQNGIIFVASMVYLMFIFLAVDVLAGLMMIIVSLWGVYVLAYNWYVITNNDFRELVLN